MKEMEKAYNHKEAEARIYKMWEDAGLFTPEKSTEARKDAGLPLREETFCVLMPPPNANAPLHCGHATYAIQDLMARVKRMQGYKTLYAPGTDHAGFETQVVYERKLKKEGKSRFNFDSGTLYKDIFNFVKENSDIAISQLKRLGMSADWTRNTFMLDQRVIDTVLDTFEKMHKDDLIYRDVYIVNYSPYHGTTFSNLETIHKESVSSLYFVKYKLKEPVGSTQFITVATVRPETIYADVAIAVNPNDDKYKQIVGKAVFNPLNGIEIPVIADSYVDIEFGTGALKITPGHDFNDFEIGKRHKLPMFSVIDLDGRMTKEAGDVAGMKVGPAREKTVEILREKGALEKIDDKYVNNLLVDYKDERPIEPMLIANWFVNVKPLAEKAVTAIENKEVRFILPLWKKEILRWFSNILNWPVSRQTVFGIRIPAWYPVKDNPDSQVVFIDKTGLSHEGKLGELLKEHSLDEIKTGLQKIISRVDAKYVISRKSPGEEYLPETDTFDTWFSSGQWPLTTLRYPDGKDFEEFFPTTFMDTMWDILFFWIARMLMFSLYLTGKVPFKNVYIHGTITDKNGQKMSKSKGNVIDPLDFVEKYGSDALRMGILVGGNTSARQTPLSEDKVRGYRNFANKIWNMARFMNMMIADFSKNALSENAPSDKEIPFDTYKNREVLKKEDLEILDGMHAVIKVVNESMNKYRFADAGEAVYQFMWHELADKYIEQVKNREDKEVALSVLRYVYINCLKLLHPFMPFVTEEIWGYLPKKENAPLIVSVWPEE